MRRRPAFLSFPFLSSFFPLYFFLFLHCIFREMRSGFLMTGGVSGSGSRPGLFFLHHSYSRSGFDSGAGGVIWVAGRDIYPWELGKGVGVSGVFLSF